MVKKAKKKEQRQLAIDLAQKRRAAKPATGKPFLGSFSHVKDKVMRSELVDKKTRDKKKKQREIRKGRMECEKRGEDPEKAGFPARQDPNTIEKMREEDGTLVVDEEDEEILGEDEMDEFAGHFGGAKKPKIMVTTQHNPSTQMFDFLKELCHTVPSTSYYKRKGVALKQIVEYAKKKDFTMLMVFTEKAKRLNGMYLCNLPDGPTSFWKLTKLKLGSQMKGGATCNPNDSPELLLNNFTTRLGRRVARQLGSIFPQRPDFTGRRSITFHNQRDFIFFRHYRYEFKKNGTRCGLQEIGPRFTLKLRYLQEGTFDPKNGEFEYQWRPDSQVSRKKMFL